MEDFVRCLLIILSLILNVTGDMVHLTMVTPTPYGAGSSASISCFRSSPDAGVALSFGRPFQIGLPGSTVQTSTTLPDGSTQSVNGQTVTQDLTSSNDATGLFYCEGSNRGLTTRVYSIVHSIRSCVPSKWGPPNCEDVCDMCYNGGVCNDETGDCICPPGFSGPNCLTGKLIAWSQVGLSVCLSWCDMCYNGGVCDDETGDCICSPGFSGPNCLTGKLIAWSQVGLSVCLSWCDMCFNGGVCDDETGDCICPPGFSGPNCLTDLHATAANIRGLHVLDDSPRAG
ncbi:platelet endothelial aggregation receptor 1-like isoform X2 [Acanthaster planci]|uniref:Platelet endothelial aggregation receptor 1-like isoform X2 n=1 Tax=Acanthaster planci TaxID=133434 RepID=A0A8B8A3R6_ACAPL|nr:platelet endothelial aggregation receptor 1-like isoform X2 [Acanthaster planci]